LLEPDPAWAGEADGGLASPPVTTERRRFQDVGAVIVTHRRTDLARRCAEAVLVDLEPANVVVVVNDPAGAHQADLPWLEREVGVVLRNPRPLGYGANLNRGVRHLNGRCSYYLLLNDDAFALQGAVETLRNSLERDPHVGLAGVRLIDAAGRRQQSTYRFPSIASELAHAMLIPGAIRSPLYSRFVLGDDRKGDSFWVIGAALFARGAALQDVDGFDESFFLYSEETDLASRLVKHGWQIHFCEKAIVCHLGGQSTGNRHRRMLGLSRWHYIQLHWGRPRAILFAVLICFAYLWNLLYLVIVGALRPSSFHKNLGYFKGHWAARPLPAIKTLFTTASKNERPDDSA
jgi:N-acetylglucosaminyl-diphospho-decaprenol L-rhamnosyltransferase